MCFPMTPVYVAVKCNPDTYMLSLLAQLGTGFDCASPSEIHTALAAMGSMNASSLVQRIIFASPCKFKSHVRKARNLDVRTATFDNIDEVDKVASVYPTMQLTHPR